MLSVRQRHCLIFGQSDGNNVFRLLNDFENINSGNFILKLFAQIAQNDIQLSINPMRKLFENSFLT